MARAGAAVGRWTRRFHASLKAARAAPAQFEAAALDHLADELVRLAAAEPASVLEAALGAIGLLQNHYELVDAQRLMPRFTRVLCGVLGSEASIDRPRALRSALQLWLDDPAGLCADWSDVLAGLARTAAERALCCEILRQRLATLPLAMPAERSDPDHLRRTLLIAERHRLARLLGEFLAVDGAFAYSVLTAKDHWRRSGDVLELLRVMRRAGMIAEALEVARRSLKSPRTWQRERVLVALDELTALEPVDGSRAQRKQREHAFLEHPTLAAFEALHRSTTPDHWPKLGARMLSTLARQHRAGELRFRIHCAAGEYEHAALIAASESLPPELLEAHRAALASRRT